MLIPLEVKKKPMTYSQEIIFPWKSSICKARDTENVCENIYFKI